MLGFLQRTNVSITVRREAVLDYFENKSTTNHFKAKQTKICQLVLYQRGVLEQTLGLLFFWGFLQPLLFPVLLYPSFSPASPQVKSQSVHTFSCTRKSSFSWPSRANSCLNSWSWCWNCWFCWINSWLLSALASSTYDPDYFCLCSVHNQQWMQRGKGKQGSSKDSLDLTRVHYFNWGMTENQLQWRAIQTVASSLRVDKIPLTASKLSSLAARCESHMYKQFAISICELTPW